MISPLLSAEKSALSHPPTPSPSTPLPLPPLRGKVFSSCGFFQAFPLVWLSGVMKMYLGMGASGLSSLGFIQLLESVGLYLSSSLSGFQPLFRQGLFQPSPSGTLSTLWSLIWKIQLTESAQRGILKSSAWLHWGEFSYGPYRRNSFYLTLILLLIILKL